MYFTILYCFFQVDISRYHVGSADLEYWKRSRLEGSVATIAPPHSTHFQDMFDSVLWLVCMQIFLPAAALYTSGMAISELIRLCHVMKEISRSGNARTRNPVKETVQKISLIFFVLEAPCVLAIGILLAAGQYGPFWLPQTFFHCGFFLFSGTSVFTTFLVALLVREEARAASHLCDRRDMLMHNRIKLSLAFILSVGFDGSVILIAVFPQIRSVAESLLGILFAGLIIGQGFSSVFFVLQASFLRSVLLEFMRQSTEQAASSRATISRLIFSLWVMAIACAGSTIIMIHFSALWFQIYSPGRNAEMHWFLLVFSMCFFRLFVSISQAR